MSQLLILPYAFYFCLYNIFFYIAHGKNKKDEVSKKEVRVTIKVVVLCINSLIGYFPNKLANNTMLYVLSPTDYNLYIPFSNILIWFSHGIKLFIHMGMDNDFRNTFYQIFRINIRATHVETSSSAVNPSLRTTHSNARQIN